MVYFRMMTFDIWRFLMAVNLFRAQTFQCANDISVEVNIDDMTFDLQKK